MPKISEFYGIRIEIRFRDHGVPHFHALYGGQKASIAIAPFSVLGGKLPPRALALVMEWASQHQTELLQCWENARAGRLPQKIDPLP